MRIRSVSKRCAQAIYFMAEKQAHGKAGPPIEQIDGTLAGFDRGDFVTLCAQFRDGREGVPIVFPRHGLLRAECRFGDAAFGRLCRNSAKINEFDARRVRCPEKCADVVHASDVVEQDSHR